MTETIKLLCAAERLCRRLHKALGLLKVRTEMVYLAVESSRTEYAVVSFIGKNDAVSIFIRHGRNNLWQLDSDPSVGGKFSPKGKLPEEMLENIRRVVTS